MLTTYERLAGQVLEDTAVMVRGLVLPEENTTPKISVQDIVALDNARIDLPGVIAIRVWIGRDPGTLRYASVLSLDLGRLLMVSFQALCASKVLSAPCWFS